MDRDRGKRFTAPVDQRDLRCERIGANALRRLADRDPLTGAINRREIAEQSYDMESQGYQQFLGSVRGGLARAFSRQARAEWKPGD